MLKIGLNLKLVISAKAEIQPSGCNQEGAKIKDSFEIHNVLDRIRLSVAGYPQAALFELFDEGFTSPFELLISCMISIRTRDEVTLPCARNLFAVARTPAHLSKIGFNEIDHAIKKSGFHATKAAQILEISNRLIAEYRGELPCSKDLLLSFSGVGPKCAHLVLGIACSQPHIGVDSHIHRIANRWGYVRQRTPGLTMTELEGKLPREYWIEINRLLVPFGKYICTPASPKCSICPVLKFCRQVGVDVHR